MTSDGKMLDGEGLVQSIENLAGSDITMFGGMEIVGSSGHCLVDLFDLTCIADQDRVVPFQFRFLQLLAYSTYRVMEFNK